MKVILIATISILMLGCGSRKKQVEKHSGSEKLESSTHFQSTSQLNSETSATVDFSKLLSEKGLKIVSDGSSYQLNFGGLVFSGSASLEFFDKKDSVVTRYNYVDKLNYNAVTTYKTNTTYQTVTTYKTSKTDRSGVSFGSLILIVIASAIGGAVVWGLIKKIIKK